MFLTLLNNLAIFYGDFSGFWHYVFKVIYCRFVVCGKGLSKTVIQNKTDTLNHIYQIANTKDIQFLVC